MKNKNTTRKEIPFERIAELNFVVIVIGITFILIGFISIFGFTKLDSMFALAIALSGAFFVISDIIQYFIDLNNSSSKTNDVLNITKKIILACSILSLLAIPFLNIQLKNSEILATAFSIIAIGLTIVNLSLNHKKVQEEAHERMISGWEDSVEQTRTLVKQTHILVDELEYSKNLIRELIPYAEEGLEEEKDRTDLKQSSRL